ncbi:lytic polysaccharide monooxygenase [Providencia sneebia]|uniref:Chitin-binding type-4 domain-containing protein n=1 Tax=Providencia sneebia DSM 19967 TaxID=1141660 RepID=K8W8H4_9GAMM|nr:lytic polysaccharide monooxygenase [Providencia sneebia]EKT56176.1 hypothetical protein OO7_09552 [Providencia sneebia DSM 19967]
MKKLLLLSFLLCFSTLTWSHGYVEEPKSRAYFCLLGDNNNCGEIQYEPQSIEAKQGFPRSGPNDGTLASAGISRFSELNVQTENRWQKNQIYNSLLTFQWRLTALHETNKWEYFITKANWQPNQPLTREQFVLKPFCQFNKVEIPNSIVKHQCILPKENKGYHVILAVWTINNTVNAFYQVIDVNLH